MKTLIIIPNYYDTENGGRYYEMPLGLGYINAAMRKANLNVECLNLNHLPGSEEEKCNFMGNYISEHNIDIVMTGAITAFYPILKKIFAITKSVNNNIITIGGGGAYTSEPIVFSELTDIDFAVIGEGDITNVELVQTLISGGDVSQVKGIVYQSEDGYKQTAEREPIDDLDAIPFPCYDGFDVEAYLDRQRVSDTYYSYFSDTPRIMPMTLARSCPYQCKFCFHPVGNRYRVRSLDNFFAELDQLIDKYHINGVVILDELFSAKVDRIYEFCERIKPYQIHWLVQMRVDIITEELLMVMKEAGCYTISYGIESYSPVVLKNMKKFIKPADINQALALTQKVGIDIQGNFILGDELENRTTLYETLSWWCKHLEYGVNLAFIETYPGTGYYKECIKKGSISDKKAFIRNGNFIVKLTDMSDDDYRKMLIITSILRVYNTANVGKVLDLYNENDYITMTVICAHCGAENVYVNVEKKTFSQLSFRIGCRKCNQRNVIYTIDLHELPNYDMLNYLCRKMNEADTEKEFNLAADAMFIIYLQIRDANNPFPI